MLVAAADDPLMVKSEVTWADAAGLELCVLTTTMRNRRILDANMAAEGDSLPSCGAKRIRSTRSTRT